MADFEPSLTDPIRDPRRHDVSRHAPNQLIPPRTPKGGFTVSLTGNTLWDI